MKQPFFFYCPKIDAPEEMRNLVSYPLRIHDTSRESEYEGDWGIPIIESEAEQIVLAGHELLICRNKDSKRPHPRFVYLDPTTIDCTIFVVATNGVGEYGDGTYARTLDVKEAIRIARRDAR